MILTLKRAATIVACSLVSISAAHAQASAAQTATTPVTARVFTPLTLTANEALRFGNLYSPFAAKTIAWTDNAVTGGRARFTITGEGGAEMALSITVPAVLVGMKGACHPRLSTKALSRMLALRRSSSGR